MDTPTRRTLLAGAAALVGAAAGCTQFGGGEPAPTPETATSGDTDGADMGDLDLREANVTAVSIDDRGGGEYRFSVELYHDDDGEDGYANWWQVETLDGEQLGRRELRHAHSTDPFTRSETISVPDDIDCVAVRGHDQTHGYGGQLLTVSIPDGATNAVRQGRERNAVDASDCP
jgi:hypothetical protein